MTHDLSGCMGKFGFEDPKRAREVAKRMSRRGRKVGFYRCHDCLSWHVGSSLRKKLRDRWDWRRVATEWPETGQ